MGSLPGQGPRVSSQLIREHTYGVGLMLPSCRWGSRHREGMGFAQGLRALEQYRQDLTGRRPEVGGSAL